MFLSSPEDIISLLSEEEEGKERDTDVKEKHQLVPPVCACTRDRRSGGQRSNT